MRMLRNLIVLLLLSQACGAQIMRMAGGPGIAPPVATLTSYSTTFSATENPILESGAWQHLGANETVMRTTGGFALGTMAGGSFDDSSAYLPGFDSSHTIDCVVHKTGSPGVNQEIELLLGWRDDYAPYSTMYGLTTVKGYEINIHQNGLYFNLGRFKREALISNPSGVPNPVNGDHFKAQIQYNTQGTGTLADDTADIWAWWNGTLIGSFPYHDTTPEPPGYPGIGAYIQSGGDLTEFNFDSCAVTSP